MKKFFLILGLFICSSVWSASYTDELSRLAALAQKAETHSDAIDGYLRLAQNTDTPAWLRGPLYFEVANIYADDGSYQKAMNALDQAVKLGYDDCLELQQNKDIAPLRNDPRFTKIIGAVRQSEEDHKEALWLTTEAMNIDHEIRMLVNANINRIDHDVTQIVQAPISTRETSSPGVLYRRELVRMWQEFEKRVVFKADKMRMEHAVTMAAINGAPDESAVYQSSLVASNAAKERAVAVLQRAYIPSVGKSEMHSCSDFK